MNESHERTYHLSTCRPEKKIIDAKGEIFFCKNRVLPAGKIIDMQKK